jgi:hypothetical protein
MNNSIFIILVFILLIILVLILLCCNDFNIENFMNSEIGKWSPSKPPLSDLYVLYSISNSPYQEWQAELLDYSFKKSNQPGTLIRLVSIDSKFPDRKIPKSSVGYTLLTPNFSKLTESVDWPVMNKPGSMVYLFDHFNFNPDSTLLFMDPDMIFLKPWVPGNRVKIGTVFTQKWKGYSQKSCENTSINPELCPKSENECSMYPFAIKAIDMKKLAPDISKFSREGYLRKEKSWQLDMSAFVNAMVKSKLNVITVDNIALCNNWDNNNDSDAPMMHYCQSIKDKYGKEIWGKRRYKAWDPVPDPSLATNRVDREVLKMIKRYMKDKNQ